MSQPPTTSSPAHSAYRQALDWIYSFSDTERTGAFVHDREDNLRRERALLAALGNPQRTYSVIHVAGTKGKGSTSAMIASILAAAGVRAGLYTSPDLHTFRERIRINGEPITEEELTRLTSDVRDAHARVDASLGSYITWEIATALAFLAFREARVNYAVIEVGLGGRLDATNIVTPEICAITSISYDHMAVLGNTLTDIAREKAGIIKSGIPVVTSAQAPEALAEIARIATERDAPLIRVGSATAPGCDYAWQAGDTSERSQRFHINHPDGTYRDLEIPLLGAHQLENAAVAVAIADTLRAGGVTALDERAIREGLRATRWEGRLQVVGHAPVRVVDGAHNADSFAALFAALRGAFSFERIILVLGLMADKDVDGILREIAAERVHTVVTTAVRSPRAIDGETLRQRVTAVTQAETHATNDAAVALEQAERLAGRSDLICVAGSLYLAGEALRWYATRPETPADAIHIAGVDH